MKIIFLANQLIGPRIATGGDKIFVEILSRVSKIQGINAEIMCPEIAKEELLGLIPPHRMVVLASGLLDNYRIYSWFLPYFGFVYMLRTIRAVFKLILRDYNVVYATGDFFPNIIPAVIYRILHKRTVFISNIYHINESPLRRRGNSFILSLGSYLLQRLSFMLIRQFADRVFLLNNIVRDALIKDGFKQERLCVVGAGLNVSEIKSMPIGKDRYEACFLGRLCPTKGIFDIPDIWERVVRKHKKSRLILIGTGSGPWVEQLKASIKSKGLESNIIMAGFLKQEEVYKVMKGSKMFIFPSYEEGWGISICEAMACKLPVVAYDLPVFEEIFDGGIIKVPKGEIGKFAEAVLGLLEDNTQRRRIGDEAFSQVAGYDWDVITEKELEIIRSLFGGFSEPMGQAFSG
ncbi:MAG: glycosyltransferase family 4 protein [Thermodesulfobacteriota bacterium]